MALSCGCGNGGFRVGQLTGSVAGKCFFRRKSILSVGRPTSLPHQAMPRSIDLQQFRKLMPYQNRRTYGNSEGPKKYLNHPISLVSEVHFKIPFPTFHSENTVRFCEIHYQIISREQPVTELGIPVNQIQGALRASQSRVRTLTTPDG